MLAGFPTRLIGIRYVNKPIDAGGDMVLAWWGAGGEEALRATCEGRFGVSAVPGRFAAPEYGRSFKCNNGTGAQGLRRLVRAASRGRGLHAFGVACRCCALFSPCGATAV